MPTRVFTLVAGSLALVLIAFSYVSPSTNLTSASDGVIAQVAGNLTFQYVDPAQAPYPHIHGYVHTGQNDNYPILEENCTDTKDGSCYQNINDMHLGIGSLVRNPSNGDNSCSGGNTSCLRFVAFPSVCTAQNGSCMQQTTPVCPTSVCSADRLEVVLSDSSAPNAIQYGQMAYESFRVKFKADGVNTKTDPEHVVINQVWQDATDYYRAPALTVMLGNEDSGHVRLRFGYQNDAAPLSNHPNAIACRSQISANCSVLTKGDWHRVDITFQTGAPGQEYIWIDRTTPTLDVTQAINYDTTNPNNYRFNLGYVPSASSSSRGPTTRLRESVGIYRDSYDLAPLWFWVDNAKLGTQPAPIAW